MLRQFGENVRRHREHKDMSQADLAREMSARGHSWYQSTVFKTEHAERRTDALEVHDLAEVLGVSIERLYWPGAEVAELALADRAIVMVRDAWRETSEAVFRLLRTLAAGERAADTARASMYQSVRNAATELDTEIVASSLDSAVSDGMARHQEPAGD